MRPITILLARPEDAHDFADLTQNLHDSMRPTERIYATCGRRRLPTNVPRRVPRYCTPKRRLTPNHVRRRTPRNRPPPQPRAHPRMPAHTPSVTPDPARNHHRGTIPRKKEAQAPCST